MLSDRVSVSIDHFMAFRFVFTFRVDFFDFVDSTVDEFFFWENGFEDGFSVVEVEGVEVFGLDFFFRGDINAVEGSELGNFE